MCRTSGFPLYPCYSFVITKLGPDCGNVSEIESRLLLKD